MSHYAAGTNGQVNSLGLAFQSRLGPQAMIAAWRWIAVNGLALLVAIYLATLLCTILLALYAGRLSRLLMRVKRDVERQAIMTEKLTREVDVQANRPPAEAEDCLPTESQKESDFRLSLASIRKEIAHLQWELEHHDAEQPVPEAKPAPATDREDPATLSGVALPEAQHRQREAPTAVPSWQQNTII